MTYFINKDGVNLVAIKKRGGMVLKYSDNLHPLKRHENAVSIKESEIESEYDLQIGEQRLLLNICEVADLKLLLEEYIRSREGRNEFSVFKRLEVK